MIISFEGLDGVGKSSISRKFAENYNFKYIERPLYEVFGIKDKESVEYNVACKVEDKVYNGTKSPELKASLTSLGLIYLHKEMKDENIVIDRDLLSNFSYNGTKESLPIFEALLKMNIYPDITFLLYANKITRMQRIAKRNPKDKDLMAPEVTMQTYEKIFKFIKKYDLNVFVINTEEKTEKEVFEEVKTKYEEVIARNGNTKSSREYELDR